MCTRWQTDHNAFGSYSYFPVAAKPEDMDFDPVYDGRLMFCGEHTMKEHNASVHGPVLSGLREARRLDLGANQIVLWWYSFVCVFAPCMCEITYVMYATDYLHVI